MMFHIWKWKVVLKFTIDYCSVIFEVVLFIYITQLHKYDSIKTMTQGAFIMQKKL